MSSQNSLPIVFLSCQVLQDMLERMLPAELNQNVTFLDYGLHRVPAKMTWTLQDEINAIPEPSLVVLGYGLCGNGLQGIKSGIHTILAPRADDCISLLLGSRRTYMQQFAENPGTYWLSKGWLESGSHPLKEYQEYLEKYGPEQAQWLMDQQYKNYKRLVLVVHNQEDLLKYRPEAQKVAQYCQRWGYHYEELLGSEDYVRKLIELAAIANRDLAQFYQLSQADDNFIVIPPDGEIRQDMFIL
jgi:hypothetical protein